MSVHIHDLSTQWSDSTGDPLELFAQADPLTTAGSYVIEPGERVPETGTTSHGGPELSVILSGSVVLGTDEGEQEVGPETFVVIPEGVDHYSENRGDEPVELVYTIVGEL